MSKNRLQRMLSKFDWLPDGMRRSLISAALTRAVPYVGTSGCTFENVSTEEVVVSIRNRRKSQNHINGVHACAMALLAETASGIVVGMNLPDDKLPLIKSMKVNYLKRTKGDMRAVATLTAAQKEQLVQDEKGDFLVDVVVTDESGGEPITCEMLWAWVPKKRKPKE